MTGLSLTVVGCSGSMPGPESPASCYLVEYDGFQLVLDLGSGALGALQRHVGLDVVGAVLLSHLHPDHWIDLCPYFVARSYDPRGPFLPLDVHGPAATADALVAAYGPDRKVEDLAAAFTFHALGPGPLQLGPLSITAVRTAHPVECWAVRIEAGGRVLAYTADTGPSAAVTRLARGADLLLAEAAFLDGAVNPPGLHLTGRQAGEMAREAQVDRLLVTHVPPWHDPEVALAEAVKVFGVRAELARAGARYAV